MDGKQVLKIGGSLLFDDACRVNEDRIDAFVRFITANARSIAAVVIGGGKMARLYIDVLRGAGLSRDAQDSIGIEVARLNARVLAMLAGEAVAWQAVAASLDEVKALAARDPGKIAFLGGLQPGQSTTTVACQLAEAIGASGVIIGTDVDGVYTKDPKKHPDAKKLDTVTLDQLASILGLGSGDNQLPGEYRIFDDVSASIIRRSRLPVRILRGDPGTFERAFRGEPAGTLVAP